MVSGFVVSSGGNAVISRGKSVSLTSHPRSRYVSGRPKRVVTTATAFPSDRQPIPSDGDASERRTPLVRGVAKVVVTLAVAALSILALNRGLTRLLAASGGPSPKTRAAVNLLAIGFAFSTWWIRALGGRTVQKEEGLVLEGSNLKGRLERKMVALPFADEKFWDFKSFPKNHRLFGRTFTTKDIVVLSVFVFLHLVSLLAPFTATPAAVASFFALHIITGMVGITFSFHRQLTHRSFTTPKFIEYLAAWIGCLTLQGDPIEWVSAHRHHHHSCDTEVDPHSPYDGFFWSHMGWMWDERNTPVLQDTSNCPDLWRQPYYRFLRKTYPLHPAAFAGLMYAVGGLPFIVWGVALRTVSMWHTTWLVNSAAHVWGFQSWKTGDISMNNWWVGLLAFGEGWHNNHHAFEDSARHGLEWWQIDVTWYLIWTLQKLGLASKVRLPSEKKMASLAMDKDNITPVSALPRPAI